jgi:nucleotide-binding universal stress UspA family protein
VKVLLATDGSPHSVNAVREVAKWPWGDSTEVKIIYVIEPIPDPSYNGGATRARLDEGRRIVERAVEQLQAISGGRLRIWTEVMEGSPKEAILREADCWKADLIVVGSHGYTGLKRFLLGSVSQAVAMHANCSVQIARAGANRRSHGDCREAAVTEFSSSPRGHS